jgi:hypothetical protein
VPFAFSGQEIRVDEPSSEVSRTHCPIEDSRILVKAHEITRDKQRLKNVRKHVDSLSASLGGVLGKRGKKGRGKRSERR